MCELVQVESKKDETRVNTLTMVLLNHIRNLML